MESGRGNRERHTKAILFLQKIDSEQSRDWISRQNKIYQTSQSAEKITEAFKKISEHENKISSVKNQIEKKSKDGYWKAVSVKFS